MDSLRGGRLPVPTFTMGTVSGRRDDGVPYCFIASASLRRYASRSRATFVNAPGRPVVARAVGSLLDVASGSPGGIGGGGNSVPTRAGARVAVTTPAAGARRPAW